MQTKLKLDIKNFLKYIKDIEGQCEQLIIEEPLQYSSLVERMDIMQHKLHSAYNCLHKISAILPVKEYYTEVNAVPSMIIKKEGNIYHYILDHILPVRAKLDVSSGTYRHLSDKNFLYNGYRSAINYFEKDKKFSSFNKKILLLFINHYADENKMVKPDPDNQELKPFIDAAISHIIVPDDNPKYISIHIDSVFHSYLENEYTEVYAGYPEDLTLPMDS